MTKKSVPELLSRRAMLRSAVSLGAVALAAPALAQDAFNDLIGSSRRGNWDDQFDANSSRSAVGVVSNNPVLGPEAPTYMQQAIMQYQQIVSNGGWPEVPPSQQRLQIGVSDPSVQALRQRLMISGDLPREAGISSAFDSYVDGALKRFQARHGLPADGVIGEYTLKALNVSAQLRMAQLQTNLIRIQTMAGDLGQRHVMVNIPAASIEAVENNRVVLRNTAVVGRASRPTHIINSKIYEIILNPYWTAPRSIVEKDIVPLMQKDPTYLERNNIRLLDGRGQEVSPQTVDWFAPKAPNLMFRQDPGKNNAMSSTKINFHNPNNEYMHDTPQQGLFNKLMRFESSGCVRVQNVRDLTTWMLRDTPGWSRQEIERVIASRVNTPIKLSTEIPVYFVYITAWSAKDGVVQFRDDIYGNDGNAELALNTTNTQEQPSGSIGEDLLPRN
ncbi:MULTISPECIES: L,D-transpeptidase family protein [Rhizobium/Agrobacterium group]|uniref:Murein L,D-transpeptidase n=1 Tax=Rhizobium rhizogenes TaxID=359 RepID=A0AA92H7Y4_RHIRH|nr:MULTISPECIES: murein L,D-transpeptidase [Rhizobium/Agrobacterium group]KQM31848.1 amidase [Rhizobium sp. Leaf202]KQN83307.1 amidase [Rhizobium sp. Leaf68]KQR30878.1 amidase [Rhizobium sp. Leaf155]KRA04982.1 amidase [Rhizobium sp. Root564]MDP9571128.1 murein L,D-transpeptidase YcbB/YkuD [Agrobacterium larrymoorei]MQB20082.1 murein L,D-transpeptidase [Agrobacterium tumefaciens]PVE77070.1 murein L,D-transpeptidase [Sphingomonas sp. TPD3009]